MLVGQSARGKMNHFFRLVCPDCKVALSESTVCEGCGKTYVWLKPGKLISFQDDSDHFYQEYYQGICRNSYNQTSRLLNSLLSIREKLSLVTRRERFFRSYLKGKGNMLILDVACGYGRRLFTEYGKVIGLDIVLEPLYDASELYDLCVHGDAFSIPFPSEYLDYIVSSDFLGHIPVEHKDDLYQELRRVLKPGGKMFHIIETDANNWHFRFAHRYPELFQKYFVEAIGGHFGLELPSCAIKRLEDNGFRVMSAKKIWGEMWQVREYKMRFDNEYQYKSKLIKAIVILSKALSANVFIEEALNILLNPISALAERLTPLDNGQGLMVYCQKE